MMDTPMNSPTPNTPEELRLGMTVYDVNGQKVGVVHLSAARDGYFVVEQGWLFTHELYLPMNAIDKRDETWVGVNLTKEELRQSRWRVVPDELLVRDSGQPIVPPAVAESESIVPDEEMMPPPAQESEPPLNYS